MLLDSRKKLINYFNLKNKNYQKILLDGEPMQNIIKTNGIFML